MTPEHSTDVILRAAQNSDFAFALHVTDSCMRTYAEQTWGAWDGKSDFDPEFDELILLGEAKIGILGVERLRDHWKVDKFYVLPAFQNRGIGSFLLECLKCDAKIAQVDLRLSVLEVNPAYRFYQRHGFVLTETVAPRHHMEWRSQ